MGFIDNIKRFFTKAPGYLSGSDFRLVNRLFGREWSDKTYLETYGKSLYVYACVSKIAEKVASVDFKLNRIINSRGDSEEVTDHPALDLLYRVNPFYTKAEFIETDVINRKLTGDSYILKVRNNQGEVAELWNIRPDLVTIKSDPELYIAYYEIVDTNGVQHRIEPQDLIHIKYPSPLEVFFGMSPLSCAKNRVDTEEYATEYQKDFFINNARPDAVIEMEGELSETQRNELREGWEKRHKGRGKSSKIGVLMGGAKYHQISLSQREMDYIESMKFTRDDILVAFKTPKPIVAVTDDVNRANAETALDIFLTENIIPEVKRFIDKLNEELIAVEYGEEYFLTFEDPVPDNREMKLKEFEAGVDKWLTRNEIRQELGFKPIEGGDTLYNPISNVPVGTPMSYVPEEDNFKRLHGKKALRYKFKFLKEFHDEVDKVEKLVKSGLKKINKIDVRKYSLLKDLPQRKKYFEYVNKNIDTKSKRFRSIVIALKNQQMEDFLKKFNKAKPKTKSEIRKLFNIREENKRLKEAILPLMISIFKESGEDTLSLLRIDKPFSMTKANVGKAIFAMLEARAMFFAKSVNNTTLLKLTSTLGTGISEGESIVKLRNRVKDTYQEFSNYRATTIARTETNAVVNEASLEAYRQSEVVGWKEWVATLDDRVRDEHLAMDGEIVKRDEAFSNGEMFPNEPNCRCVIAPVIYHAE